MKGNIEGLRVELTDEDIEEIENAAPFNVGFPLSIIYGYGGEKNNSRKSIKDIPFVTQAGHLGAVEKVRDPKPRKEVQ